VQSNTWRSLQNTANYGKRKKNDLINRSEFELYDLEKDPDEVTNLATNKKHSKLLENMNRKLKRFQE